MKTFQVIIFVLSIVSILGFPLGEDVDSVDFPILKPADSAVEENEAPTSGSGQQPPTEDDQTEFPILKPNPDDFQIDRPEPTENNNGKPSEEQSEDKPVERPRPEVDPEEDGSDLPSLVEFYPNRRLDVSVLDLEDVGNADRRRKSSSSADDSDVDETDDTVVVDAASCEDLKRDCDESNGLDWITCESYKENCTGQGGENEDKEASQVDNCVNGIAGKGGDKADCPSLVAKP